MRSPYIDPVCGMRVESDKISTVYDGKRHVFCSTSCQQKFLAHPAGYPERSAIGSDHSPKGGCCG